MSKKDKYRNILEVALSKASQALSENDFGKMEESMDVIAESYGKYMEIKGKEDALRKADFATLQCVLESALPRLFAKKDKALRDITKLIREDKNLMGQFKFLDAMKKYDNSSDANNYVCESIELACRDIDTKSVAKSNARLADALIENEIIDAADIDEDERLFNENCNYVLSTKKSLRNLNETSSRISRIGDYIKAHPMVNKGSVDVASMAESIEKKAKSLNEDEKRLIKTITEGYSEESNYRKEKLFNEIKASCLDKIHEMIRTNEGYEKERLVTLKETIESKPFNADTIVEDIAKLLEIGAVLTDK